MTDTDGLVRTAPTPTGEWTPASWRTREAAQPVHWPDGPAYGEAMAELRRMPPLIVAGEADQLRRRLAEVQQGRAFALFAGDCAESFHELSANRLRDQLKLVLQMSIVLTFAAGVPVIKIGRVAGQFGKPRSNLTETIDGVTLPVFRGHNVNGEQFTEADRRPDPARLVKAYHHSSAALNLLRGFASGGFADLQRVHMWNREFLHASPEGDRYEELARQIDQALRFVAACGHPLEDDVTQIFTAHEALVLDYEEPLTRLDSLTETWFGCSAHFLWVGERTRQLDGAHLEYLRGVNNPVGVKIGPSTSPAELIEIVRRINPDRVPGRMTLITRLGADNVQRVLPDLARAVTDAGEPVAWVCDPMHGNTHTVEGGIKTRDLGDVMGEIQDFFTVLRAQGVWPGGVHLELTPEDVTECTGGSWAITEEVLMHNYLSLCDPRLNGRQALDLAFQTAALLQG